MINLFFKKYSSMSIFGLQIANTIKESDACGQKEAGGGENQHFSSQLVSAVHTNKNKTNSFDKIHQRTKRSQDSQLSMATYVPCC